MEDRIFNLISNAVSQENIRVNEPLSKHTTFKIGGNAAYFVSPTSDIEMANLIKLLNEESVKYYVLGNGSNVLAPDEGYPGVIIYVGEKFADISLIDENVIYAKAGAMLGKVARFAMDNSLTGMEFAAGIPGSIGGAIYMNAGAYGGEMKDIVVEATVCDKDGKIFKLSKDELDLSYRHSSIEDNEYVVLDVTLKLEDGDFKEIKAKVEELAGKRLEKQPLEYPSAGSTFKRPEGYFAGKLIEDAGLRGYAIGDACVSEKHCGFVVNKGNASAAQIMELIEYVSNEVYKTAGVRIEPEVKFLG